MDRPVRLDKWLWAARFFKTRQLAIKAVKNQQIKRARERLKPASTVSVGDLLTIKKGLYEVKIEVLQLSEQRGSAKIAQTLYRETQESRTQREKTRAELANQPKIDFGSNKPNSRAVRSHRAAKRGL